LYSIINCYDNIKLIGVFNISQGYTGIKKLFNGVNITCIAFGNYYLMEELEDEHDRMVIGTNRIRIWQRYYVTDINAMTDKLVNRIINVGDQERTKI